MLKDKIITYGEDVTPTREEILSPQKVNAGKGYGCAESYRKYCARLIQYDGWDIKDDYPVKF